MLASPNRSSVALLRSPQRSARRRRSAFGSAHRLLSPLHGEGVSVSDESVRNSGGARCCTESRLGIYVQLRRVRALLHGNHAPRTLGPAVSSQLDPLHSEWICCFGCFFSNGFSKDRFEIRQKIGAQLKNFGPNTVGTSFATFAVGSVVSHYHLCLHEGWYKLGSAPV